MSKLFPSEIIKKITLQVTEGGAVVSTYEFSYNPSELTVDSSLMSVKSNFLRHNRAVVRPTQLESRTISGKGVFLDDYVAELSAFDYYKDLEAYQFKKEPLLFTHEKYGAFKVIIERLTLTNTGSYNSVSFNFTFIETRIDKTSTGFERGISNIDAGETSSNDTKDYTVVSGDSLWKIALRFYGDGSLWPKIYEYNKEVIGSNPNLIYPGQKFRIPDVSASSGISGGATPVLSQGGASSAVNSSKTFNETRTSEVAFDTFSELNNWNVNQSPYGIQGPYGPSLHNVVPDYAAIWDAAFPSVYQIKRYKEDGQMCSRPRNPFNLND